MEKRFTISAAMLFLVEGKDEERFLEVFISRRIKPESNYQIVGCGGKDNLPKIIKLLTKTPGFHSVERLVVIRDADDSAKNAFESVRFALERAGLPAPQSAGAFSACTAGISAGVYILPNCKDEGMLEDLLISSFDAGNKYNCIQSFWDCVERCGPATGTKSKGTVQVFLAAQEKSVRDLGAGAEKGCFNFDSSSFEHLRGFLKSALC